MPREGILQVAVHGFHWKSTKWLENFLSDRWQRTRVGDRLSEPRKIISGVIQGSCIGHLLFPLYINSLAQTSDNNTTCVLFADNVKL